MKKNVTDFVRSERFMVGEGGVAQSMVEACVGGVGELRLGWGEVVLLSGGVENGWWRRVVVGWGCGDWGGG